MKFLSLTHKPQEGSSQKDNQTQNKPDKLRKHIEQIRIQMKVFMNERAG